MASRRRATASRFLRAIAFLILLGGLLGCGGGQDDTVPTARRNFVLVDPSPPAPTVPAPPLVEEGAGHDDD